MSIPFSRVMRLGKRTPVHGQRPRPLLLVLVDPRRRNPLLRDANKKLAEVKPFDNCTISMKKDMHPKIHQEYKRLHQVESAEKQKPENVGKNIRYVHDTRSVMVDDQVVDRFQPLFF